VLVNMRRDAKGKELEALLAGEQDSCSCYIEVAVIELKCSVTALLFLSLFMPKPSI